MSAPAVMPLCIGDYIADTGHLTTIEHGAYLLLIMHYWQHGGLPNDDEQLARIAGVDPSKWLAIAKHLLPLWQVDASGCYRHKRIDKELLKAKTLIEREKEIAQKRRNAGKLGGLAKAYQKASKSLANARPLPAFASATPPILNTDEVLHLDSVLEQEPSKLASTRDRPQAAKRATRIPANFQPDLVEAERLGLSRHDAETEAAAFADYWRAKPVNATKLDWEATWRNWVRKSLKDHKGETYGHGRRPPPGAQESPTRVALRIARGGKA